MNMIGTGTWYIPGTDFHYERSTSTYDVLTLTVTEHQARPSIHHRISCPWPKINVVCRRSATRGIHEEEGITT
jgi:hypothetical protein